MTLRMLNRICAYLCVCLCACLYGKEAALFSSLRFSMQYVGVEVCVCLSVLVYLYVQQAALSSKLCDSIQWAGVCVCVCLSICNSYGCGCWSVRLSFYLSTCERGRGIVTTVCVSELVTIVCVQELLISNAISMRYAPISVCLSVYLSVGRGDNLRFFVCLCLCVHLSVSCLFVCVSMRESLPSCAQVLVCVCLSLYV